MSRCVRSAVIVLALATPAVLGRPIGTAATVTGDKGDSGQVRIVTDQGRVVPPAMGHGDVIPATTGTGETVANVAEAFDDGAAAEPMSGPVGTQSVIGVDKRQQDADTTQFPDRAVALILSDLGFFCTGWIMGPDSVATAGHCVDAGVNNGGFYPVSSYRIYPGRNGSSKPFGVCRAERLLTNVKWHREGLEAYDYGGIDLACETIGRRTGTIGFFTTDESLVGAVATIRGYPGDKLFGTQWRSVDCSPTFNSTLPCEIDVSEPRQLFYDNDTYGGMSGSPVLQWRSGCGACAMAIHGYGLHGSYPHDSFNHGSRVSGSLFTFLRTLRAFEP